MTLVMICENVRSAIILAGLIIHTHGTSSGAYKKKLISSEVPTCLCDIMARIPSFVLYSFESVPYRTKLIPAL
jgi:hypothetical protein